MVAGVRCAACKAFNLRDDTQGQWAIAQINTVVEWLESCAAGQGRHSTALGAAAAGTLALR